MIEFQVIRKKYWDLNAGFVEPIGEQYHRLVKTVKRDYGLCIINAHADLTF